MAISFGSTKQMQLWHNGDTTTNWPGSVDGVELSGIETVSATDWYDSTNNIQYYKHAYQYSDAVPVRIAIFNKNYQDIMLSYTLKSADDSILISQVYDRVSVV